MPWTNKDRARDCDRMFEARREPPEDDQAGLIDALADLMHWAERQGVDFDDALSMATDHYSEERNES